MSAVIELQNDKRTYRTNELPVSTLNGVSFQVAHGEMEAVVVGSMDTSSAGTRILDDLHLSRMSDDEQAVVCTMLAELNHSLSISSALARDMLTGCKYGLEAGTRAALN